MTSVLRYAWPLLLASLGACTEPPADSPECAAIRRGVSLCEGPTQAAAVTCSIPAPILQCAEVAPTAEGDGDCMAFLGCLYDGPN